MVRNFVGYLFDSLMINIPQREIDNMVNLLLVGNVNTILKAKLIASNDKTKYFDITKIIKNLSNFNHIHFNTKDIYLGDTNKLSLLGELLEDYINSQNFNQIFEKSNSSVVLTIKYINNGMKHSLKCLIDKNWKILKKIVLDQRPELPFQHPNVYKPTEFALYNNENVIPLTNHQTLVNKTNFINLIQSFPLLNYYLSFENGIENNNENKKYIINVKFKVFFFNKF